MEMLLLFVACVLLSPVFGEEFLLERRIRSVGEEVKCVAAEQSDYSNCACAMNDTGKYVNLAPLANSSIVPRFTVEDKGSWRFSYNPCTGFDMFVGENNTGQGYRPCENAAMGRWTEQSTHQCFTLGASNSSIFTLQANQQPAENIVSNLTLTFTAQKDKQLRNQGVISLVCNPNITLDNGTANFQYINVTYSSTHTTYFFSLESECCCPGMCGSPPQTPTKEPKTDKLNTDLVIGLSVAAGVLLIILIAVIFCLCCRKKNGYTSV